MRTRLMRAELFQADRRMDGWRDMTKLIVDFHGCANVPKKRLTNNDKQYSKI